MHKENNPKKEGVLKERYIWICFFAQAESSSASREGSLGEGSGHYAKIAGFIPQNKKTIKI